VELIEVGGGKIAYRRAGAGNPLVLLHGAWSDGREWLPQLAGLSNEFDVIAWNAPGCGGSDDPSAQMGMADYAEAVADLVTVLHLGPVHLCGLSFGGGLALEVYRRHPRLPGRWCSPRPMPAGGIATTQGSRGPPRPSPRRA
jgi:pimeloyl-ACP methyl ester carboxylesterase